MLKRQVAYRLCTILLLPLLLVGGTVGARKVLRCRYTGVILSSCCCPEERNPAPNARIDKACCCDVDSIAGATSAPATTGDDHVTADSSPCILSAQVVPLQSEPRVWLTRIPARGGQGPPLILLKQSFLL